AKRGHHKLQVTRDRCLTREDVDCGIVECVALCVDACTQGQHIFCKLDVRVAERGRCVGDCDLNEFTHLNEGVTELRKLVLKSDAHGVLSRTRCPKGNHLTV